MTPAGTAMSAAAFRAPGWVAMSSTGDDVLERFVAGRPVPLLFSEVYLADTGSRGDAALCRVAHHRSFGEGAANAGYDPALGRPGATSSPTATRVVFASDWYDSGRVDAYVLELAAYTPHDLAGTWVDANDPNLVTTIVQAGIRFGLTRAPEVRGDVPFLSTVGTGTLEGDAGSFDYTVRIDADRSVRGACAVTVGDASERLEFACEDRHFGRVRLSLVRP